MLTPQNVEHAFNYMMCNFHVCTTFHWFDFRPKDSLPNIYFYTYCGVPISTNVLYSISLSSKCILASIW